MTALQWAARAALPVALVLWLLSLRHVNLNAMTDLGLLQVLPVLFWIALGLLALGFCVALSDRRTRGGWLAAYVLVLIAILHATPALLYPTLRYGWAWKHVAVVDAMIRNGGSVPGANKLDVYDQWPGFFHLNALVMQATGLESSLGYAVWAPPLNNVLLLAPLLLIYRAVTTDRRLVWGAVWIFYSCSWVGQDYFAPQAFAFLLFVTLIALVMGQLRASAERSPGSQGRAWPVGRYLLVVLIMAVVVCSHPLTPLMMLSALVALSLPRRNRRVLLPVLGAGVLLTLVWDTTVARPFVAANLSEFVGALLEPDSNVVSGLAALGAAAPGQVVVSWVDRGLSAAVFLLAALAFVMRRWTRRTGMPLLVLAPMPVLLANSYGDDLPRLSVRAARRRPPHLGAAVRVPQTSTAARVRGRPAAAGDARRTAVRLLRQGGGEPLHPRRGGGHSLRHGHHAPRIPDRLPHLGRARPGDELRQTSADPAQRTGGRGPAAAGERPDRGAEAVHRRCHGPRTRLHRAQPRPGR
jgi:hypothetical protein